MTNSRICVSVYKMYFCTNMLMFGSDMPSLEMAECDVQ